MNIIEAYEYLAHKLSLSEREVLDVIYKSAGVDKPQLDAVLALPRYYPSSHDMIDISRGEYVALADVVRIMREYGG